MTTPQIGDLFEQAREATARDIQVVLPATVASYALGRAKVKPAVCPVRSDGSFLDIPVISDCPVLWPGGGGWEMTFPLAAGDTVLLVIASSSVDEWKLEGNPKTEPSSERVHDFADAFVIAEARPTSRPRLHASSGFVISDIGGLAALTLDTIDGAVVTGTSVKLGSDAASDPVASTTKTDVNFEFIKNWGVVVETAINGLAPGTFTPANTIFNQFPTVAMAKVFGE